MSKDPAFLFYSSDFLTGVAGLTMEERGQYVTLLCLQHQTGHLSPKTIRLAFGYDLVSSKSDVMTKFSIDADGCYFNKRLELEIAKRSKAADSHREAGKLGGKPKNQKATQKVTQKDTQTVNVNEDANRVVSLVKKGESREERFSKFYQQYPKRVARPAAEKAFAKIKPDDALFAAIMAGLAKWSASDAWAKDGGQYIPNPATWLNNRQWEDELLVPGKPAQRKPANMGNFEQRTYSAEDMDSLYEDVTKLTKDDLQEVAK